MKWFLLSARDSDKFALYRNSSLLSTASSLIFSRPCLCCHATDRKPPSVRFVKMQWILPLPKLTLCQGKFVETELMENPLTLSSLALPFASCVIQGSVFHQEGESPWQRTESRRGWNSVGPTSGRGRAVSYLHTCSMRHAEQGSLWVLWDRCTGLRRKLRVREPQELTG